MSAARQTDVLVVGAGPTGLMAALTLAEAGLAVEIVDEEWRPAGHSYALALHPRSLRLLASLGLLDDVLAHGRRIDSLTILAGDEPTPTTRCALVDERYPFLLSLPQSTLERLLSDALTRMGIRVHWSHRLAALEPRGDSVQASVERLEKESAGYGVAHTEWTVADALAFRAGFVVGADGHRSLVRRALATPLDEAGPSQVFAIFECTAPSVGDEQRLVLREDSVNALWPLPDGRARWSMEIGAAQRERRGSLQGPAHHDAGRALLPAPRRGQHARPAAPAGGLVREPAPATSAGRSRCASSAGWRRPSAADACGSRATPRT